MYVVYVLCLFFRLLGFCGFVGAKVMIFQTEVQNECCFSEISYFCTRFFCNKQQNLPI